ncbi:MAG TPA: arginine N-succinyltransferase [Caulobacterales bacterium]|nr:arginine N-succinyltransferase [Caulobacterales bacterium]
MSAPAYVVRAAGPGDFAAFQALRREAGPGFTSLMLDDPALRARLEASEGSFASSALQPGSERYLLALEHVASGEVAGCCGVKATIGQTPPFFNFRVLRIAQSSAAAQRRFDMSVLILVNEFTGCSEVGSLFVRAAHRAGGIGRTLAQARYLLMASAPQRFHERVVSELRGVVGADGVSPFWEALGRHFFKMDFHEADRLSATTDNQFILDLMPKYPIYADLLPESARAVIGECHVDGAGARRLLEWEGFAFSDVVDIFDGGPLLSASRDSIRTAREAKRVKLALGDGGKRALIARPDIATYRCTSAHAVIGGGEARVSRETLDALKLEPGAEALVWCDDAV